MKAVMIANRGEIAVRVIRTLRAMGIASVLIASEVDQSSLAAKLADRVTILPGNAANETYLDIGKVIAAARDAQVDGIHPGYGFLSERDEFSSACAEAGIKFIGPSAESMSLLGNKVEAKILAQANQVPLVPGFFEPNASDAALKAAAEKIGCPLLLKAAAGGGGRGMRAVTSMAEFDESLRLAREEAISAFGDGEMMVEKLVGRPRHIEVQLIADTHGQVVALYERECSLQRRRQKVVEEAGSPLPACAEKIWPAMREAAIRLLRAAKYVGAATAEFLVDEASGEFYFLEVNARLQVEHPVTESVTGLDLVRLQVEVARGDRIKVPNLIEEGDRRGLVGHAIECRIIAENPGEGFRPSIGRLRAFAAPSGPGIRVDTGFAVGDEVSRWYDSLLAKLIVFDQNREAAIRRTVAALRDFHILGVDHNIGYLLDVIQHPDFRDGHFDVNWLDREFVDWKPSSELPTGLGTLLSASKRATGRSHSADDSSADLDAWNRFSGFRNAAT